MGYSPTKHNQPMLRSPAWPGNTANPSSSGTATAMGTMQTAALPTQVRGFGQLTHVDPGEEKG